MYGETETTDPRLAQGSLREPSVDEVAAKHRAARAPEEQTGAAICARPSLRDRVGGAHWRAEREARRRDQLSELIDLLDRNPAVTRILELIEATGV